MKPILAIDPGKSGGIAWTTADSVDCAPLPQTEHDLADLLRSLLTLNTSAVAYVEDVPKFCGPKLPGSTLAVLFFHVGLVRGLLAAWAVRTILVKPHDWQRGFDLGTRRAAGSHRAWKLKLKAEAQRRFPHCRVTDATADALLILDHARRQSPDA